MTGLNWSVESRNRYRDWEKIITAVVVEAAVFESYREKMLKSCRKARALRDDIHTFFFSVASTWRHMNKKDKSTTLVTDKKWMFADGIYVDEAHATDDLHGNEKDVAQDVAQDVDEDEVQMILRSEYEAIVTKNAAASKRKGKNKVNPTPRPVPPAPAPAQQTGTTTATIQKHASATSAAAKDAPPHQKPDDIVSLLSSLKNMQKHKLLQCSDPDAPVGNTESIVSFAVSIITHVRVLPLFHSTPPSSPFLRSRI